MRILKPAVSGVLLVLGWLGLFSVASVKFTCYEYMLWVCSTSSLSVGILLDSASVLFLSVVFIITGSIIFYCEWYMDDEVFKRRFFYTVMSFVASMGALILIPNLITLLIGWDGLGVTSFLLVIYYQSSSSLSAGMITALTNRIGDVLILCCSGYMGSEGTWLIYECDLLWTYMVLPGALMVGSLTKSAQVPFSAWLPAAMAAPTPVSALVHSSTLVTAGVYLMYRCSDLVMSDYANSSALQFLSLLTVVLAGGAAVVEIDMKKIVAFSTLSQLGMMMFVISIGFPGMALFHLCTHALFKALLFMCVGVVIHSSGGCQDVRLLGFGWKKFPVSMVCMEVAMLSLCGIPFMSGYYSKDYIVEMGILNNQSMLAHFLLIVGVVLTFWYSIRFSNMVIMGMSNSCMSGMRSEESIMVKVAYSSLLVGAVVAGYVFSDMMESLKVGLEASAEDKKFVLVLGLIALYYYQVSLYLAGNSNIKSNLTYFSGDMWGLKHLSGQWVCSIGLNYSDMVYRALEKGWLEKIGPQGVYESLGKLSQVNQWVQSYSFFRVFLSLGIIGLGALFLGFVG